MDRLDELLVVALVLVGVAVREVGDCPVERVAAAQARGDGDRVPGAGVRPGQRPPARRRGSKYPDLILDGLAAAGRQAPGDADKF